MTYGTKSDVGTETKIVSCYVPRVLTFHIESSRVHEVLDALDHVRERFEKNPDFRGLICLEGQGERHQVTVLTLWDGRGLEIMRDEDEDARQQISDTCDFGVRSEELTVLRYFRGDDANFTAPTTPYRVVLIDDDEARRASLKVKLEDSCRFVVVGESGDGKAGAAIASRLSPDLVVLDMSLPGGGTIGTLHIIHTESPTSHVVVVSGLVSADLVNTTVTILGASSCLLTSTLMPNAWWTSV